MSKIKAILFDYDGTLSDSRSMIYEAYARAFIALDIPQPTHESLAPHIHHHSFVHEAMIPHIPYEDFEDVYRAQVEDLTPTVRLYNGAKELLDDLHKKDYIMGIVTAAKYAPEHLKQMGLAEYFNAVVSGGDLTKHKPDPQGINLALERLQIAAADAVYVGDMPTDIYAAKAAGLRAAIGVTTGFANRRELETAEADIVIDTLSDLSAAIAQIEE